MCPPSKRETCAQPIECHARGNVIPCTLSLLKSRSGHRRRRGATGEALAACIMSPRAAIQCATHRTIHRTIHRAIHRAIKTRAQRTCLSEHRRSAPQNHERGPRRGLGVLPTSQNAGLFLSDSRVRILQRARLEEHRESTRIRIENGKSHGAPAPTSAARGPARSDRAWG